MPNNDLKKAKADLDRKIKDLQEDAREAKKASDKYFSALAKALADPEDQILQKKAGDAKKVVDDLDKDVEDDLKSVAEALSRYVQLLVEDAMRKVIKSLFP